MPDKPSRRRITPERRRNVSRRSFVATFVGLLADRTRRAAAATPTAAKRLLVFFNPNGTVPARWRPSGSGTSFSFPAGSILEPLAAWRDRVVVIGGLELKNANNHEGGMAAMLTGGTGGDNQGKSIDQHVAGALGSTTRLRSLEVGVQTSAWGGSVQTRMSYSGPGQYVPPDDSPVSVYGRLYGDALPGGAEQAVQRRQSVIDAVRGDVGALRSRLGSDEAAKLDIHLESLRELERSLGGGTCGGGTAPVDGPLYDNDRFPTIGKAQMDLAVAALACGATNVASIQWAHTVAPQVFSWISLGEGHHSLSHQSDGTAGVDQFIQAERWFTEQFAYLLGRLDATPDPDGGTLLESTLVLWSKEMGDSRLHVCTDVPMVIAGAGFQTGRYLATSGAAHAKMLVSIANALGVQTNSFGDAGYGAGPLSGL